MPTPGRNMPTSPAKLRLLALLLDGTDTAGDLAAALGISPSSVYQHLAWLHGRGLVVSSAHGRAKAFALAPAVDQPALRRALLEAAPHSTPTPPPGTGTTT